MQVGWRLASLIVGLVFLFSFCGAENAGREDSILLLYMLGCDLETDSGAATDDLHEICIGSAEAPEVTIYAYLTESERIWLTGIREGNGCICRIAGGKMEILRETDGNGGTEAETLAAFLKEFGGENTSLILWGHGVPEERAIGYDRKGEGTLPLAEIQDAITESGIRLRGIGFDACGMATLEAAFAMAPYCERFAASPEKETLRGWNYGRTLREGKPAGPEKMTLLETEALLRNEKDICRVMDSCGGSEDIRTLGEAAAACTDREAAGRVLELLQGQELRLGDSRETGNTDLPEELREAYRSFLDRK